MPSAGAKTHAYLGLEAIYPKPKTSISRSEHRKYPYLLKNVAITRINQIWAADITYIRIEKSWAYLVAIIDWYSRYVIGWKLSATMESDFCVEVLFKALRKQRPKISNSDQGVQFTSASFTRVLRDHEVKISMDGRGRCVDNIFTERLWRSLKYGEVYIKSYATFSDAEQSIDSYFQFYNERRPHQSLGYQTPAEVYLKR